MAGDLYLVAGTVSVPYWKGGPNFFLEINPMFLLKGTFISDWTEGYDRNEGYASFVYRW